MDVLTVIKKKPELLIPSGTLPEVVWRESTSKSGSKSHGFTLSHRETPAGYMILYISPQSLSSGTSPLPCISWALTQRQTSSSLSTLLLHKMQHVFVRTFKLTINTLQILYLPQPYMVVRFALFKQLFILSCCRYCVILNSYPVSNHSLYI